MSAADSARRSKRCTWPRQALRRVPQRLHRSVYTTASTVCRNVQGCKLPGSGFLGNPGAYPQGNPLQLAWGFLSSSRNPPCVGIRAANSRVPGSSGTLALPQGNPQQVARGTLSSSRNPPKSCVGKTGLKHISAGAHHGPFEGDSGLSRVVVGADVLHMRRVCTRIPPQFVQNCPQIIWRPSGTEIRGFSGSAKC